MQSQLLLIFGLIGSTIVVIAYLLNQTNRLASSDLPAATIEFFWAAISLYGLVRSFRQQSV